MGLNCSHDAWDGAYSAFNRFRKEVVRVCGGSLPPHDPDFRAPDGTTPGDDVWFFDDDVVPAEHVTGIQLLVEHSDCDGELRPSECGLVAAALRWAAPLMTEEGAGHLADGGPRAAALRFAAGCELASRAGEPLLFG